MSRFRLGVGIDLENNDIKDQLIYGVTTANMSTYLDAERKIAFDTTTKELKFYDGSEIRTIITDLNAPAGTLADLEDTTITSPADAHILVHDTTWKNVSMSGIISMTKAGVTSIADNQIALSKLAKIIRNRILGFVDETDTDPPGNVEALTAAQVRTMINVADGANAYSHPNDGGGSIPTPLTGPAVISKLVVNGAGHVTETATRNLSANDIGAAAAEHGHAHTDITFSTLTNGHVWRATGSTSASFGTLTNNAFEDLTIGHSRLAGIEQYKILSRTASGSGVISALYMTDHIHRTLGGGTLHAAVTTSSNGFMSSADKVKLNGIANNANNYSHGAHTGDVTTPGSDNLTTTVAKLQGRTLTMGGSAAFTLGITLSANTSITLPTSGTLSTLGNAETFTGNKTFSGTVTFNGNISGSKVINSSGALSASSTDNEIATAKLIYEHVNQMVALGVAYRLSVDVRFDHPSSSLGASSNNIDGVTTVSGLRVLVTNSGTAGQINKAYIASGSAGSWSWTVIEYAPSVELPEDGYMAWVKDGTVSGDTKWAFTGTEWIQIGGTGTYTDSTFIEIYNSEIRLKQLGLGTIIGNPNLTGQSQYPVTINTTTNHRVLLTRDDSIKWDQIINNDVADAAAIAWSKLATGTANRLMATTGTSGAMNVLAAGTDRQFMRSNGSSAPSWSSWRLPNAIASGDVDKVLVAHSTTDSQFKDLATLIPESVMSSHTVILASANNSITIAWDAHPFSFIHDVLLWRFDSATEEYRKYQVDYVVKKISGSEIKYNVEVSSNTNWPAGSYLTITGKKFSGTDLPS
jgi:hypothetical protein